MGVIDDVTPAAHVKAKGRHCAANLRWNTIQRRIDANWKQTRQREGAQWIRCHRLGRLGFDFLPRQVFRNVDGTATQHARINRIERRADVPDSVPGGVPVPAAPDLHVQRNREVRGTRHPDPHDLLDPIPLPRGDLDDEFVVDLQKHARTEALAHQLLMDAEQRDDLAALDVLRERGIGIVEMERSSDIPVALIVELTSEIQRLPDDNRERPILGIGVPLITIDAMTASAPSKVALALDRMGLKF